MLVQLKNETGRTIEKSFDGMDAAAKWCIENADFGITLYPENGEPDWDSAEFQATLEMYQ